MSEQVDKSRHSGSGDILGAAGTASVAVGIGGALLAGADTVVNLVNDAFTGHNTILDSAGIAGLEAWGVGMAGGALAASAAVLLTHLQEKRA
jgi:hypothetical protein